MRQWALHICFLFLAFISFGQQCPDLLDPIPNSTEVPVDNAISWSEVIGVTGYIISIGTSSGGGEIVNEQAVGNDTTFYPPLGLPESTQIFVTITLFFFDQPNIVCPSQSFRTAEVTTIPECTNLISPVDGEENVNVGTLLNWGYAPRALGYRITIETNPGTGDIINNLDVGNNLLFNPPGNLPFETRIYISIEPYNENGFASNCAMESFTTAAPGKPPGCTNLITPENGELNVELSPFIEWVSVPNALGYIVNIGSSPFINDVLDEAVFTTNSTFVINFEANKTYYVRVIPFNDAGQAQNCPQESFSTILGCGPFYDEDTGELIYLGPEITLPDEVGICEGDIPTRIDAPDLADGYRWFKIPPNAPEVEISDQSYVELSETGRYRYEAYNILNQDGVIIECANDKEFTAILSSIATIDFIAKEQIGDLFFVMVEVSGIGDYEFALNAIEGPYSDDSTISGLLPGNYTLYVRDKGGCGIAAEEFRLAYPPTGFPTYFSPNGDGIRDFWQYVPPEVDALPLTTISIYDRFGKILAQFKADGEGWDGRYNGTPMPLGGYWYRALTSDNRVFKGHFSLIR